MSATLYSCKSKDKIIQLRRTHHHSAVFFKNVRNQKSQDLGDSRTVRAHPVVSVVMDLQAKGFISNSFWCRYNLVMRLRRVNIPIFLRHVVGRAFKDELDVHHGLMIQFLVLK